MTNPKFESVSLFRANYTLAVLLAAYMLSLIDRQILSLMIDPIRRDLDISDLQIGLLQGFAFSLLYSTLGIPVGVLADRLSRKWIITAGVITWSAATILCSRAASYPFLFVSRMLVGTGEATLSPSAHSLLSDSFPPERLTRALAIYTLGITLGVGIAFLVGGSVIQAIAHTPEITLPLIGALRSWQAAFIIVGAPGFVVAALTSLIREPRRRRDSASPLTDESRGLRALVLHLKARFRAFSGIYLGATAFGIATSASIAWYPTMLMRTFHVTPGQAGLWLGLIYIVLGSSGAICGALVSERLAKKGHADANLRVVLLCAMGSVVPGVIAPLMPSFTLTCSVYGVACFISMAYFPCATASIQAATPPHLRATNAACFLLFTSLLGTTVGAIITPLIDRTVFGGGHLAGSLSLVWLILPIAAALLVGRSLSAYGEQVRLRLAQS